MVSIIGVPLRSLFKVGFTGLCMETADHRETPLEHWIEFEYCSKGLWRTIRCFVSPSIPGIPDTLHLLLDLPWLYDINAVISIRDSTIQIGDPKMGEPQRRTIRSPRSGAIKYALETFNSMGQRGGSEALRQDTSAGVLIRTVLWILELSAQYKTTMKQLQRMQQSQRAIRRHANLQNQTSAQNAVVEQLPRRPTRGRSRCDSMDGAAYP